MDNSLPWIRSFVEVVEADSFSGAARRLGLGQSTMSKHLAALESHLAVRLFHRTTRTRSLTDEGAAFYEHARRILDAMELAEASVGADREPEGVVRVTVPLTLAASRIIPLTAEFLSRYPRISIDLRLSDHALNLVADSIDVAIRVGRLVDSGLVARRIGTARRMMVASPAYLDRLGRPATPVDLAGHNCLTYSLLASGRKWVFVDHPPVAVGGNFTADSPDALRSAALAGIGIVLNATWLFEADIADGTLEAVLADYPVEEMPIHALLPSGRLVSTRTRAFVSFLAEAFERDPLLRP